MNLLFGTNEWVFQQDGATYHTSRSPQIWCHNNFYKLVSKMEVSVDFPLDNLKEEIKKVFKKI